MGPPVTQCERFSLRVIQGGGDVESDSDEESDRVLRHRLRTRLASDPDSGLDTPAALVDLCEVAVDELNLLGVAVSLMTLHGQALAGASDDVGRRLEEITFSVGEGPSREAFLLGRPVLVPQLESALVRWPGYVPEAVRAGVGGVYAFPLQLGASKLGVLSFYAAQSHTLSEQQLLRCLVFADLTTEILLAGITGDEGKKGEDLVDALRFRNEVYQAQGVVMVQLDISLVEALARMRAHAYANGLDLNTLALGVVTGSIRLNGDRN